MSGVQVTSFDDAWEAVRDVDGWMTHGQARELFDAAASCPAGGTIVEIGSFHGRSTIVLALACAADVTVYAIEPHAGTDRGPQEIAGYEAEASDDHTRFVANLERAGVSDKVQHIREFSGNALALAPSHIDVLYIDGAHRYAPARADIRDYGQRVRAGGTMLIHDSFSSIGVTLAIGRELAWSARWTLQRRARSLAVYEATSQTSPSRNLWRHVQHVPWFLKNVALKVALTAGLGRLLRRCGRPVPEWPY